MRFRSMFWILSAIFAAMPFVAEANDDDMPAEGLRILSDFAYMPLQGEVWNESEYLYVTGGSKTYDSTGTQRSTTHSVSNTLVELLTVGVADDFDVFFLAEYDPFEKTQTKNIAGDVVSSKAEGFTDPGFGVNWRAIDQAQSLVNLDFGFTYYPDLINSRSASATGAGNLGRGGQAGRFSAAISHVFPTFTLWSAFYTNIFGARQTLDQTGTFPIADATPYEMFGGVLASQIRLGDRIAFDVSGVYNFVTDETITNLPSGVTHFSKSGNIGNVSLGLDYEIIPNRLVVGTTYDYSFQDELKSVYPVTPPLNSTIRDTHSNRIGVKLDIAI